jgi:hypothetical protein
MFSIMRIEAQQEAASVLAGIVPIVAKNANRIILVLLLTKMRPLGAGALVDRRMYDTQT